MNGMGMLHLEVKQHRLERDFRLKVRVGKPRVSYRETLQQADQGRGRMRQASGHDGLFAKVTVEFEPHQGRAADRRSSTRLPPETLPPEFMAAAEQGIRGALQSGELGYPVIDVQATMRRRPDGARSSPTTSPSRRPAPTRSTRRCATTWSLLEPVMRLEVTVPEEYLGPVTADLNARRAEITRGADRAANCA